MRFTLLRTDSAYAIFSTGTAFGTATQFGSSLAVRTTGTTGARSSSSTTNSLIMSSNSSDTPVALGRVTDVSPNGFTVTMSVSFNIDWGWEAYA